MKDLFNDDLLNRLTGFTITETVVGSMTLVQLKDGGENVVAESKKLVVDDAYRTIREDIIGPVANIMLIVSQAQRDQLSNIDEGTPIYNLTSIRNEVFSAGGWVSSAGLGVMAPAAYGNMFEDSASGSAMDPTTKQWVTASGGEFDENGIVSFSDDSGGDRLVIGAGGTGDYMVVASCGQTNSGSNRTTMAVHINDVDTTVVKDDQNANNINHRALVANGILSLVDNDFLTIHIVDPDTPSNVIKVFDCHLTVQRVS